MNTSSASWLSFRYEKAAWYNFRNSDDHVVQTPDFIGASREAQQRHVTWPRLQDKFRLDFKALDCLLHAPSLYLWPVIFPCSLTCTACLTSPCPIVASRRLCLFCTSDCYCHSSCFASRNPESRLSFLLWMDMPPTFCLSPSPSCNL